jgi:hypothetical protein
MFEPAVRAELRLTQPPTEAPFAADWQPRKTWAPGIRKRTHSASARGRLTWRVRPGKTRLAPGGPSGGDGRTRLSHRYRLRRS